MKKTLSSLIGCTLLFGCGQPKQTIVDFPQEMNSLSQHYFAMRPEIASYFGVSDKDAGIGVLSKLSNWSPSGEQARRKSFLNMLNQLNYIDVAQLTTAQQVSLNLIKTEMTNAYAPSQIVNYGSVLGEYGIWFLPYSVSHLSGPHVEFLSIMEDKFAVNTQFDADAFIERLQGYSSLISGVVEKIQYDQEQGVIPPDFIISNTIANLKRQINQIPEQHPLYKSFAAKLTHANIANKASLLVKTKTLLTSGYYPQTKLLINTLTGLLPLAKHQAGIGHLPNGKALYQALITHFTDTHYTAQEIHDIGLAEVARIDTEMDVLLKQVGYNKGTVGERMQILLNDPQYLYPNTPEGKKQLLADIKIDLNRINQKLPQWFGLLPNKDVDVKAVPSHQAAASSGAFYDAPSQDGTRKGTFWISLHDTASLPSYSLQTLTYHETNPGHHLQTIIGLSDELPLLSTIFYSNAAGEGWGLYAERLASEMGLYKNDPIDDLGRLQAEMHRAVRLVVDTGMHALGWSREKAIEYSMATEGNHILEATSEIERYTVWPGQALGYKLGELKIRELRDRAKTKLGNKFDIRDFHDQILEQGALPLNIMEDKVDAWLATK